MQLTARGFGIFNLVWVYRRGVAPFPPNTRSWDRVQEDTATSKTGTSQHGPAYVRESFSPTTPDSLFFFSLRLIVPAASLASTITLSRSAKPVYVDFPCGSNTHVGGRAPCTSAHVVLGVLAKQSVKCARIIFGCVGEAGLIRGQRVEHGDLTVFNTWYQDEGPISS